MLPPSNLPSEESPVPEGLLSRLNGLRGERSALCDGLYGGIAFPGLGILE